MKSFKDYVTMNEKASVKKGHDLKVGDVILYGREDTPHEVTSKPKQDGTGYWVEVLNLSNKKKDKIYVDSGDTVTMNEKDLEDLEDNINENSKISFDRVTPADSKGKKAIVYKYEDGRESYPVEFYPSQIDEKQLLTAVRKILG